MDNIKLDFQKHIDAGRCNGAEWIINYKNNIYHEAVGYRDLELKNKLNKNSYYRIWSMTKPIIGFAAMQLIEKNLEVCLLDSKYNLRGQVKIMMTKQYFQKLDQILEARHLQIIQV